MRTSSDSRKRRAAAALRRLHVWAVGMMLSFCVSMLSGCERDTAPPPPPSEIVPEERVALPTQKSEYEFAVDLEEEYPEVVGFMRHFLETCLAGDYTGYRRLVTRRQDPESSARFERILHALRKLTVLDIQPADLPGYGDDCFVVTNEVQFHADNPVTERRGRRQRVAILVFKEEGAWRMGLAPSGLQPEDEPAPPPTTEPATTLPSYPWDEDDGS